METRLLLGSPRRVGYSSHVVRQKGMSSLLLRRTIVGTVGGTGFHLGTPQPEPHRVASGQVDFATPAPTTEYLNRRLTTDIYQGH
jgi:hypothetical protein